MDAITTSGSTEVVHATTLRGEWARFGSFLRRPVLPERAPLPSLSNLAATGRLLVLDLIIMLILLAIGSLASASGIELPETALAGMELGPGLILAAVIVAPLGEEIAFRSWLSGRPGHLLALILVLGGGASAALAVAGREQAYYLAATGVTLLLAALAIFALRRRGAMGWFTRIFPVVFWISALLFASAHLFNFAEGNLLALAPLVLPQFATGLVLGYVRVNYGLWSSMLIHVLHNSAFIGLVLLANGAG